MRSSPSYPPLPVARWVFLAGLLAVELLFLTVRFDAQRLSGSDAWWAYLVSRARVVSQMAAAAAAALLLLHGRRVGRVLTVAFSRYHGGGCWVHFLVAHGLAFAGFAVLTATLLEGNPAGIREPWAWSAAWGLAGGATLGLWAAASVPPVLWPTLFRHAQGALLTAAAVGLLAFGIARYTANRWDGLHAFTFRAVHALLHGLDLASVCDPEHFLLGTTAFTVEISAPCAGYEGIGLLWVFLGATFWFARYRLRFPNALLLLPLGSAALWAANVVRIAVLVVLGTWWSPELAVGGFHSQAGWLAFNAVALGLLAGALRLPFFVKGVPAVATAEAAPEVVNPTAAYLMPLLVSMAAGLLTIALAPDPAARYPLRAAAGAAALLYYRRAYPPWGWEGAWRGLAPGTLVFALWMGLAPPADAHAPSLGGLPGAAWLACRLLGAAVVVPLVEELAFRGYLLRRLSAADFESLPAGAATASSAVASSALFGLLHGGWLAGFLAGLIYAWTLRRRGSLAEAAVAHGTTNALLAAHALLTGDWSRWS